MQLCVMRQWYGPWAATPCPCVHINAPVSCETAVYTFPTCPEIRLVKDQTNFVTRGPLLKLLFQILLGNISQFTY